MPKAANIEGQVFGRLTAIRRVGKDKYNNALWECYCTCATSTVVSVNSLRRKDGTRSCGCLYREAASRMGLANVKHGGHSSKEYGHWHSMRLRCNNPNNPDYPRYGGAGVTICERWDDFALFLEDMGEIPGPQHSLDRFPNPSGNYEPGNVRWATVKDQANNRRNNVHLEHDGIRLTVSQWAEKLGIGVSTLHERLKRGWSVEETLTTKPNRRGYD